MKQASRMYIRKHTRPRNDDGRFAPGYELWTREDGQSRWVRSFAPAPLPKLEALLNDDSVRHLVALVFVVLIAALALFVR